MSETKSKTIRKNVYRRRFLTDRESLARAVRTVFRVIGVSLMVAGLSVVFLLLFDITTQSGYFAAEHIAVTGCGQVTRKAALEQAGIEPAANILSVNLTLARKRLLAHPWIADAEVRRELPSGLHVGLEEHRALGVFDLGRRFLIDAEGIVFKEAGPGDPEGLPEVTGLGYADIPVGGRPPSKAFSAVLRLLVLGRREGAVVANGQVRRIEVDPEMGITLFPKETSQIPLKEIRMGFTDYTGKLDRLKEIIAYLQESGSQFAMDSIDLNNLDRIVVDPGTTESSDGGRKEV